MRITKKKIAGVVAATTVVALGSTAAFAYWTGSGSADGSTTLAAGFADLHAALTIADSGTLMPGGSVQVTSASISNPNASTIYITGFDAPTFTFDAAHTGCSASWFTLTNLPASIATPIPAANGTTVINTVPLNIQLTMSNLVGTDQGDCKNATITVTSALHTQTTA
ncbi:MAG TPA: hypothetical protein VGJ14_01230 [Sporichthyaceae bacterium]|jgi:hypothetical protein